MALQIHDDFSVFAVMDGCSSGDDSHFASALMGKLLHKACKLLEHPAILKDMNLPERQGPANAKNLSRMLLRLVFENLKTARQEMFLNIYEMLSTLLLMVYDHQAHEAYITVKGDGYVAIDGTVHEIDENDVPRYPAYYLTEDFETWIAAQNYDFYVRSPKDISIATDGVGTYLTADRRPSEKYDPVDLFLNKRGIMKPHMLELKSELLQKLGLRPLDDVSVIRLIFDEQQAQ